MRVNYVAAFQEIEFEFLVDPAGDAEWADKWQRLVLAVGGGEFMRREPYREEEAGPEVAESDA